MEKMSDLDLKAELLKAATYYIEKIGGKCGEKLPPDERQRIYNYLAVGFYMGWREAEKKYAERTDG